MSAQKEAKEKAPKKAVKVVEEPEEKVPTLPELRKLIKQWYLGQQLVRGLILEAAGKPMDAGMSQTVNYAAQDIQDAEDVREAADAFFSESSDDYLWDIAGGK